MDASDVIGTLADGGIDYMVTGSTAMNYYTPPRNTGDIDLLLDLAPPEYERRLRPLFAGHPEVYVADLIPAEPDQMGQLTTGSLRFDLIIRPSPWTTSRFARRDRLSDPALGDVWVTSVEDLILAKIESHHALPTGLQWTDALRLRDHVEGLDWAYVELWALRLSIDDDIRALRLAPPLP